MRIDSPMWNQWEFSCGHGCSSWVGKNFFFFFFFGGQCRWSQAFAQEMLPLLVGNGVRRDLSPKGEGPIQFLKGKGDVL